MLECKNLSVFYGQHHALDQVSVSTAPGEIVVILGANGAGKSSLLKAIAGIVHAEAGSEIRMDGVGLAGMPAYKVVETGLALVPEGRGIFGELTVLENLTLGAFPDRADASEAANLRRVLSLFPVLNERKNQIARTMSGGEQQMVAIGRAIMSAPSILMLDEPSLGLSPILSTELFRTLEEVRKTGVGILLVEQNAKQSLAIADRGYLLEVGRITGEDTAERLMNNPAVQQAYLGGAGVGATGGRSPTLRSVTLKSTDAKPAQPEENTQRAAEYAITPSVTPSRAARSDQVIPGNISDIVSRAIEIETTVQDASLVQRRHNIGGATPDASDAVKRVLSEMEQSARDARFTPAASQGNSTPSQEDGEGPTRKPIIEVYRKPKIEVYKRQGSAAASELVRIMDK